MLLGDGALDGLGGPDADRAGQAQPARAARAAQPLRAPAPRRADPHRRQEARPDPAGAGHRVTGNRALQASAPRRARHDDGRLGVRPRLRRRRHPPGLRRGPRRREGDHRGRLPAPRGRVLPPPRHHRRARDDRQRLGLPLDRPRARLPRAGHPPPPHPALPAPAPTAKPSASSAPCSAAGPTARSTAHSHERTAALDGWLWTLQPSPPTRLPQPQAAHRSPQRAEQPASGPTASRPVEHPTSRAPSTTARRP